MTLKASLPIGKNRIFKRTMQVKNKLGKPWRENSVNERIEILLNRLFITRDLVDVQMANEVPLNETNFWNKCVLRKMFFVFSQAWDKEKFWVLMRNRTSDFRIPRSDALPLSHRDSTVSEVYYEVHMTRVLHTAKISDVDSVMYVNRNSRDGKFWARWRTKKDVFRLVTSWVLKPRRTSRIIFPPSENASPSSSSLIVLLLFIENNYGRFLKIYKQ